jgi:hypothetical protein
VLDKYAINCFTEPLGEARVSPASLCQGPLTLLLKEPGEDRKSPATVGKLHLVVEVNNLILLLLAAEDRFPQDAD